MRSNAFTVIELCIVLSIIAVTCSLVVPTIQGPLEETIVNNQALLLVGELRLTQRLALEKSEGYSFLIDTDNYTYTIRPLNPFKEPYKKGQIDKRIYDITSSFQKKYDAVRVITYTPTGIPGRTGTVYLHTRKGRMKSVSVAVGTGRVRVN